MMYEMKIQMVENGFIVTYTESHKLTPTTKVFRTWAEVLDCATRYFEQG